MKTVSTPVTTEVLDLPEDLFTSLWRRSRNSNHWELLLSTESHGLWCLYEASSGVIIHTAVDYDIRASFMNHVGSGWVNSSLALFWHPCPTEPIPNSVYGRVNDRRDLLEAAASLLVPGAILPLERVKAAEQAQRDKEQRKYEAQVQQLEQQRCIDRYATIRAALDEPMEDAQSLGVALNRVGHLIRRPGETPSIYQVFQELVRFVQDPEPEGFVPLVKQQPQFLDYRKL